MTRITNSRIAGFTFLFYIAVGITSMVLFGRAASGEGVAAQLASVAQHVAEVRVVFLLGLLTSFCAIVLAVTLFALTREQDEDLARLALICRVAEGIIGITVPTSLVLLWLATTTAGGAMDSVAAAALAAFLLKLGNLKALICAMFFSVGSTLHSWLFLKGRIVPAPLAWLGLAASVLLVALLPLQLTGVLGGAITNYMWIPMALFEVALALWLMVKGAAAPAGKRAA